MGPVLNHGFLEDIEDSGEGSPRIPTPQGPQKALNKMWKTEGMMDPPQAVVPVVPTNGGNPNSNLPRDTP